MAFNENETKGLPVTQIAMLLSPDETMPDLIVNTFMSQGRGKCIEIIEDADDGVIESIQLDGHQATALWRVLEKHLEIVKIK